MIEPTVPRAKGSVGAVLVLAVATFVHAGFRMVADTRAGREPVEVSELRPGQVVPELSAFSSGLADHSNRSLDEGTAGCRIFVVYDTGCPYSVQSARREAARPAVEMKLPVLWLTEEAGGATSLFRSLVHASSEIVHARGILDRLSVNALPAGFLVSRHGTVVKVWPYRGDELHGELDAMCREPSKVLGVREGRE